MIKDVHDVDRIEPRRRTSAAQRGAGQVGGAAKAAGGIDWLQQMIAKLEPLIHGLRST